MKYQDTWINGVLIEKGKRDCAGRYEIIKRVALELKEPFTVCDIGTNMGYFPIRLSEDFDCAVTAFEFDHFSLREDHIKNADINNKIKLINQKIRVRNLDGMAWRQVRFDLLLAMSVLHHMNEDIQEIILRLRKISKKTIIEFAVGDSKRTDIRKNYYIPSDGKILGYGDSHLSDKIKRPIILFENT